MVGSVEVFRKFTVLHKRGLFQKADALLLDYVLPSNGTIQGIQLGLSS